MKTLYPIRYNKFVEVYTEEYNLEKSFVYAVIKCESNFDSEAVSNVDAKGLMQIMPETFSWLKTKTGENLEEKMLFDPETSIKYGCLLYEILIKEFGDKETAVAAYHAGLGNVSKWLKDKKYSSDGVHLDDIPFPSTKAYVQNVIKAENIYKKLYKI
ncbi:MAG: lytic transglycosylase domain-containing protein [Acutalibacteraceae bacterium]